MPVGRRKEAVFECLLCRSNYTIADARRGLYFVLTQVCANCYNEMAASPVNITCFGKKQTKKHVGYSPKNLECRILCPDRSICPSFIKTKEKVK